jgi:hypothetical protein
MLEFGAQIEKFDMTKEEIEAGLRVPAAGWDVKELVSHGA